MAVNRRRILIFGRYVFFMSDEVFSFFRLFPRAPFLKRPENDENDLCPIPTRTIVLSENSKCNTCLDVYDISRTFVVFVYRNNLLGSLRIVFRTRRFIVAFAFKIITTTSPG